MVGAEPKQDKFLSRAKTEQFFQPNQVTSSPNRQHLKISPKLHCRLEQSVIDDSVEKFALFFWSEQKCVLL